MGTATVQVYCAISLDGYIAGEDDDLSWLEQEPAEAEPGFIDFASFMAQTGAMLMGRRTYDAVMAMGVAWPYGDTPVEVVTHRPLGDAPPAVRSIKGEVADLIAAARARAGEKNVYLDGGSLISQALDAGLVDELILTRIPILLGAGVPLYQGEMRHRFRVEPLGRMGEMLQTRLDRPRSSAQWSCRRGPRGDR
ncbi:MAG: dihydrofolate reductase family protein [Myxococcales bacterium]|nr:dihydrofolate reductase family protein [Myxococcales bacterium]